MNCSRCPGGVSFSDSPSYPSCYASLTGLDVTSSISNVDYLTNSDTDLYMPSDLNFDYFTMKDFHSSQDIMNCLSSNSLSFLNCNFRSLRANFDNLVNMLSELCCPISITGVTVTKLKNNQEVLLNIDSILL